MGGGVTASYSFGTGSAFKTTNTIAYASEYGLMRWLKEQVRLFLLNS